MEITSSYQVEILSNTDMKNTVQIYRRALAFVVDVCNKEWTDISSVEAQVQKKSFVEKLIHPTKNNPNPKYPFDIKGSEFYKFPSYLKSHCFVHLLNFPVWNMRYLLLLH